MQAYEEVQGYMARRGLTVSALAEITGLSRVHLSRILHGHRPLSADAAIRLELALELDSESLLASQAHEECDRLWQENKAAYEAIRKKARNV